MARTVTSGKLRGCGRLACVDEMLRKAAENAKGFMPSDEGTAPVRGRGRGGEALPGRGPRRGRHVLRQVDALPRCGRARGRQRHRRHGRPPHRLRGEPAGLGVARRRRWSMPHARPPRHAADAAPQPLRRRRRRRRRPDRRSLAAGRLAAGRPRSRSSSSTVVTPRSRPRPTTTPGCTTCVPAGFSSSTTSSRIPPRAGRPRSTCGSAPSPRASSRGRRPVRCGSWRAPR